MAEQRDIAIIGTGDYARGLAKNFIKAGFTVYCGSRNPNKRNLAEIDRTLSSVRLVTIQECTKKSDVIFLCIHAETHKKTLSAIEGPLRNKVLVDVSNPKKTIHGESNAECLQKMLPESRVVKAFNTISAYTLQASAELSGESKDVYICGNNVESRAIISQLTHELGFHPVECGTLKAARDIENMPLYLFKGWGKPTLLTLAVFLIWLVLAAVRTHVLDEGPWKYFAINTMNKVFASSAITLLTLCFLPGLIAAILQMINGTKYKRFPKVLDLWLKGRKQLGLYAFAFGLIHGCLTLVQLNPGYYPTYYEFSTINIPGNATENDIISLFPRMITRVEVAILFGVFTLGLMTLLGVTSIPAVGTLLNWREWSLIQSKIGWVCLVIAGTHLGLMNDWNLGKYPAQQVFGGNKFLSLMLPSLALIMKMVLVMPCINNYVWKIRRGYEKGVRYDSENVLMIQESSLSGRDSPSENGKLNGLNNSARVQPCETF